MQRARTLLLALAASAVPATALAQDAGGTLSGSDLPPPSFEIQRLAPDISYEFGMHFSFGTVTYWRDFVPAWIGFGGRFSGGKHLGDHRIGGMLTASAEGPIGVQTSISLEPHATWEYVSHGGLQLGAGVGPALMYHQDNSSIRPEHGTTVNPSAAARIGWSQTWTRVGRRLFLVAEPKVRLFVDPDGTITPNPLVAVVVGSGGGR